MELYTALTSAIQIIHKAKTATAMALGSPWNNPAYDLLLHAATYLEKQAKVAMRGE